MKKLHAALAMAGAIAGTANAQSAVEIYGILDMGFVRETGRIVEPTKGNLIDSGVQSGTRLGFKGTEDLGAGLKGLFVLETGIAADSGGFAQGNTGFSRQSFVGLQSDLGTLTFGRQYTSHFLALNQVADPFASGLAGNAQNLMLPTSSLDGSRAIRMNNTIKYASPIIAGFSGELAYGFGETAGNSDAGRVITGAVGYDMKPIAVRLSRYERTNSGDTDKITSTLLAANADFGVAKVFAAYGDNDWLGVESRDYLLGARMPFGPHTLIASYIHKEGRGANTGNDADQWGFGYTYTLSKRTNLYAAYGKISNDGAADYTVGNNSANGTGEKALNLGVRHLF